MWVITRAINEYNQYGDYFVCVFSHKPSSSEVMDVLGCDFELAWHIIEGGGRLGYEHTWYYLTEMESGIEYLS